MSTQTRSKKKSVPKLADLDEQFHRILYTTLNNQTLMKLFEVFWTAFQNLDIETIQISEPAVELEEHRRILEAVKDGDVALTRQQLVQHFSHLIDRLRRATEAGETGSKSDASNLYLPGVKH